MADPPPVPALRPTDLLPPHFDGTTLDHDLTNSWFMSFMDYLVAHNLANPADAAAWDNVVRIFKCRLTKHARLWAEGQHFDDLDNLKTQFLARFSPNHSLFANVRFFEDIKFTPGHTAQQHLGKIQLAAQKIVYNEAQVRNKFLQTLPQDCQRAVIMGTNPEADVNALARAAQQFFDLAPKQVSFESHDQVFAAALQQITSRLDALDGKLASSGDKRSPRPSRRSPIDGNRHFRSDRSKSPSRGRSRDRACHFCGRPGHTWRYCYKMQQQVASGYLPSDFVPPAAQSSQRQYWSQSRPTHHDFQPRPHSSDPRPSRQPHHDHGDPHYRSPDPDFHSGSRYHDDSQFRPPYNRSQDF